MGATSRLLRRTVLATAATTSARAASVHAPFRSSHYISNVPRPPKTLITGGLGQLGRSLAVLLRDMHGPDSILLTDIARKTEDIKEVPFCYLNIMDRNAIDEIVVNYNIDTIVHFSALLSAVGEQNVPLALQVNSLGVQNVLEVARTHQLRIFVPSTIGAFGPSTPRDDTPDLTIQRPRTIYGVTKVYAELLGEYYHAKFGTDFRSLRFPGVISAMPPGGGTTDYAIKIFYDALTTGHHTCYLRPETRLPMMFDSDCMASVIQLLAAPSSALSLRTYNVTGFSFTPEDIADEIRKIQPDFKMDYDICPVRQSIADSWPRSICDDIARRDWGWAPEFDLSRTTRLMFDLVADKIKPHDHTDMPKYASM